jgi:hypothetical protein
MIKGSIEHCAQVTVWENETHELCDVGDADLVVDVALDVICISVKIPELTDTTTFGVHDSWWSRSYRDHG